MNNTVPKPKRIRTFWEKMKIRHNYNKRTGLYPFFLKNILKFTGILVLIGALIFAVEYFFDLQNLIDRFIQSNPAWLVLSVFLVSESVLGWIPPDLFIIWAEKFQYPYLMVFALATISYIGGINAYFIGKWLYKFPKIHNYVTLQNELFFKRIKKWGGFLVVFAALFPLPYATTATVAGMVHYSFKKFLLYGTTRYLRFFIYAQAIYYFMKIVEGV